jgi:hypothetical protein
VVRRFIDRLQYDVSHLPDYMRLIMRERKENVDVKWYPLYMLVTRFVEQGSDLVIVFQDINIRVPVAYANAFWYVYKSTRTRERFFRAYNAALQYNIECDYRKKFKDKKVRNEDGQMKLFLSHLELLLDEQDPEVHILFIGSNSEERCIGGRTSEVLIDYLSKAGYCGSITLYDPFEIRREYVYGGFIVRAFDEKYVYDDTVQRNADGCLYTHVFDDVWVPMISALPTPVAYSKIRVVDIPMGESRFAYKVVDDVLVFKAGLAQHKDFPGGVGGGLIRRVGNRVFVYGS